MCIYLRISINEQKIIRKLQKNNLVFIALQRGGTPYDGRRPSLESLLLTLVTPLEVESCFAFYFSGVCKIVKMKCSISSFSGEL
ncbi:hypothetical protein QL285_028583 [Trifolium repens]|nr:hypothetical protein QL285_028583 [Trifolium repens]